MSTSREAVVALAAALATACGGKPEPQPTTTATSAPDSGTPQKTGDAMSSETTIPAEAYRLAAGADGWWAWAPMNGGAYATDGAAWHEAIAGSSPATSLAFSADGKTLFAGPATFDVEKKASASTVTGSQLGVGLSGKAMLSYVGGYQMLAAAWAPAGDLAVVSVVYRAVRRESAPPPEDFPQRRLLAFDSSGALVADMGKTAHPLIAIGADRVFATGGLTIDNWKRADLSKPEKKIAAHPGITALVLSRDEATLAYGWNDGIRGDATGKGMVVLWDIAGAKERATWQVDAWVFDVAWSADGTMVATAGTDGAKVWKLDGTQVTSRAGAATAVAFTPDGKQLLVGLAGTKPAIARVDL
jgi:WD40 repeat protein